MSRGFVEEDSSLMAHLSLVPDPRVDRTRRHDLLDILAIAVCAVIGGADHWSEVADFGTARKAWFEGFLKLPNGIPSHDTFTRVFRQIDADALEQACAQWLSQIAGRVGGVVALDGKTVRGSGDGDRHPLHIVSAWASETRMLLGQVRTQEKSNEITAIPELLRLLSLEGCIVTIDAMGCQKAISHEISQREADYVLGLKANHPTLHHDTATFFEICLENGFDQRDHSYFECSSDKPNHGRLERREHWLVEVPAYIAAETAEWKDLRTLALVRRQRQIGDDITIEDSFYLSSLPLSAGAQTLAHAVRSHWGVENELHWSLDVAFREDACRVRKDNAPANLAVLRRIALTQLRRETSHKRGIQGKRRRAGWDLAYLESVLNL